MSKATHLTHLVVSLVFQVIKPDELKELDEWLEQNDVGSEVLKKMVFEEKAYLEYLGRNPIDVEKLKKRAREILSRKTSVNPQHD